MDRILNENKTKEFVDIEQEELEKSTRLFKYKLEKLNDLVLECYSKMLENDQYAGRETFEKRCAGITNQILLSSYKEATNKLKKIYFHIIRKKLEHMKEEYEQEYLFFMELLEYTMESDFLIFDSM